MTQRMTIWVLAAAVAGAAWFGAIRAAHSEETGSIQLKKDIQAILATQNTVLAELAAIREELNIVKIRCSS